MLTWALNFAFAAIGVAMVLNIYRFGRGPDVTDRIIALDTLYINTIALLLIIDIRLSTDLFFEAAVLIAMMGFIGTVALAKHARRGSIIE